MLSLLSFRKASVQLLEPNPAGAVAAIYEVRASEVARRIAIAAVGRVIGIAVAARVVVVIEAETAGHETPVRETPFVAEVAACWGKVLTHNSASESAASTAEMPSAKTAAYASATTDVSTAGETADVAAAEPADVAAAEAATMSTPEAPTVSTSTARKCVSGQSPGESGSRREDDHRLT